jgi:hypothetical protein
MILARSRASNKGTFPLFIHFHYITIVPFTHLNLF